MKPFAKIAAFTFGTLLALTGCAANSQHNETKAAEIKEPKSETSTPFPVTVEHNSGETEIKSEPTRVIVFDMGALDTIDAIGAGDKVIGVPTKSVPTWLKDDTGIDYSTLTNVGTLKEPDLEAVAKLQPDLVILGGRTAGMYDQFAQNFTTVNAQVDWNQESYLTDISENVLLIGQALGKENAAKAAAQKIDDAVAKYQDTAKGKGSAMVLMTNAGEISLHGLQSRWAPIWSVFGFAQLSNTTVDEGHKGTKISFETVQELNPDYIFAVDRDAAIGQAQAGTTAAQVLDNDFVNSTLAAKNGHITYLSPERWYIVMTGANNFLAMLDEINAALEQEK